LKKRSINNQGYLICQECGQTFKNTRGLSNHIQQKHNKQHHSYYDKFLKEFGDDICKICGEKLKFISITRGYGNTCSGQCSKIYVKEQTEKSNLKKFGVKNPFQRKDVIHKISKKQKSQTPEEKQFILEKRKQTCLEKYGVEYTHQNPDVLFKSLKSGFKVKRYKNTEIWYQGSYEYDLLEKYHNKIDIQRAPSIPYKFKGKNNVYHPDLFIPSKNLIVECKSSWWYEKHKDKVESKKESTLSQGYNFIMILDKDYSKFI
jgi:hypothetical protein